MGRAAAIAFAREGADVAINYLPAEEPDATEVGDLIRAEGRNVVQLPGDIRDEQFCTKLVADAVRELGGLDILVNNAARQISHDSLADITTQNFDDTFKTNVYAMFWITKAALPHLQPGAAIINTASVNAYEPRENIMDYAATKGAIMIFTKGLAQTACKQGHSRQRRRAWPCLDGAAGDRRSARRQAARLWQRNADGPAGTTGGAGAALRPAGLARS